MTEKMDKYTKRRLRSSYASVVVSISLVLFMLGMLGLLVLNARKISDHVKENFVFTVMLNPDAKELEVRQFQKSLDLKEYVLSTEYVSADEAAELLKQDLDEDFVQFLGYNPLSNSIDIHFKAAFAESELLESVAAELAENPLVQEVAYDKPLIQLMNENIRKIGLGILGISALLTVIAVALINSSIRLSIYSRRFLIKTMQLVGATKTFIRQPFLWRGVRMGLIGSLIALALLAGLLFSIQRNIPELVIAEDIQLLATLAGGTVALGIFISWICTFFAVRKYLRLKTDELYF